MNASERNFSDEELQAFVDDELDQETREAVESYLQQHPDKAQEINDFKVYNVGLHQLFDPVLDEAIPRRLKVAEAPAKKTYWPSLAQAASLFLAIGVGVIVGWISRAEYSPAPMVYQQTTASLVKDAFAFHVVYAPEVLHPVEVDASQQKHLSKWLSKRLKTEIAPPQLDSLGFHLLGGRLLESANEPAAQFMYENEQGKRLTVFARQRFRGESETAFQYARAGKINGFYWVDDKLSFVIVSDVPKQQISKVSHLVYQALNT